MSQISCLLHQQYKQILTILPIVQCSKQTHKIKDKNTLIASSKREKSTIPKSESKFIGQENDESTVFKPNFVKQEEVEHTISKKNYDGEDEFDQNWKILNLTEISNQMFCVSLT